MKAVGIVILSDNKKQILLCKRSKNEEDEIGKWENAGGKLEEGETFEEAVIREAREELGVLVTGMSQLLMYGDESTDFCIKLFSVQIKGDPKVMEPYYCDEIKWFDIDELDTVELANYALEDFKRLGWIKS